METVPMSQIVPLVAYGDTSATRVDTYYGKSTVRSTADAVAASKQAFEMAKREDPARASEYSSAIKLADKLGSDVPSVLKAARSLLTHAKAADKYILDLAYEYYVNVQGGGQASAAQTEVALAPAAVPLRARPWFMPVVGVGALAVLGGGAYWYSRRKR